MLKTIAAFDRIGEENAFAVLARAMALAAQGRDIVNLGIGQPDFRTPDHIVEAAVKALRDGHHGYTPATGILPLREAVAADLHKRFGATVSPDEVMIMPGGKPTMFMSILMFGEPGVDILYPDPGFPIYRSMIEFTGARPVPVPIREENGFAFRPRRRSSSSRRRRACSSSTRPPIRPAASRRKRRLTSSSPASSAIPTSR
jgi:aspartate/methionine/tyrosine aminotransferase